MLKTLNLALIIAAVFEISDGKLRTFVMLINFWLQLKLRALKLFRVHVTDIHI